MKQLLIVVILIIFFSISILNPLNALNSVKGIYIHHLKAEKDIDDDIVEQFSKILVLSFLSQKDPYYRIYNKNELKELFPQAKDLLKEKCINDKCIKKLKKLIDVDLIIFGEFTKKDTLYQVHLKIHKKKTQTGDTETSAIKIGFPLAQLPWYAEATGEKIIDPGYMISSPSMIKPDQIPGIEGEKITELPSSIYQTDDSGLKTIMVFLKNEVIKADKAYQEEEYREAQELYYNILNKIKSKISSEKQKQTAQLRLEIYKRLAATYFMDSYNKIKDAQEYFNEEKYEKALSYFQSVYLSINEIKKEEVKKELEKVQQALLMGLLLTSEKIGDQQYYDYKFADAVGSYDYGIKLLDDPGAVRREDSLKQTDHLKNQKEKVLVTRDHYFKNSIYSYRDQINIYNLRDENFLAKDKLREMREYIDQSKYKDKECENIYEELEKLVYGEKREVRDLAWRSKKILINFEFGAGHMLNVYGAYRLKHVSLGAGLSFTYDTTTIMDTEFSQTVFTPTPFICVHLYERDFVMLAIRERIGFAFLKLDSHSANAYIFSTDFIAGYKNFFGILSTPFVIGSKGSSLIVRVGLGYQLRYDL